MKTKINVKTFILALNTFGTNVKKAKTYLNDKRLTQSEKTILQCFLYLRDNQLDAVVSSLQNLVTNDQIVESQKKLFLGLAYNNQNHHTKAIPLILEALELMAGHGLEAQEFIALNNLFIIYRNLKDLKRMQQTLQKMHQLGAPNDLAKISLLRADFKYASVSGNYKEGEKYLQQLEDLKPQMAEAQIISHLVDQFDFYIKTDRFTESETILQVMKDYRKFHLSSNYNFMKLLIQHYIHNKTLYVTDSDFKDFPMLFQQIKVIQKLEESDVGGAKTWWQKLATSYPNIYGLQLGDYQGDKCLFSICLKKHEKVNNVLEIKKNDLPKSKEEALVRILQTSEVPLHQESIYELLWEEVPESKLDLNKLAQLVYTVKNKTGLDIRMKKSCYFMEKKKTKIPNVS